MIVRELTLNFERKVARDYKAALEIEVDGTVKAGFWEGEPEDAGIYRDFNDVFIISDLMRLAYEAGIRGEPFIVIEGEIKEE